MSSDPPSLQAGGGDNSFTYYFQNRHSLIAAFRVSLGGRSKPRKEKLKGKMNYNLAQQLKNTARVRRLLAAAFVIGCAIGATTNMAAQSITSPPTPTLITPPEGQFAFLLGNGAGTQGYVCLPTATGASWTVNNPRPEATLTTNLFGQAFQIITHFLSPNTSPNKFAPDPLPFANATWQGSFDSSKVWAQTTNAIPAGSHPSCPNAGAIGCLLLQVIGAQAGPTGGKLLTPATYIQRLNTKGGSAPADGCSTAADVGKQSLVPYTADYYFFREGR